MAAPRKIDWDRIEPEWRAGLKSVLQIAAEYEEATKQKVSHTAINKHFKQLGIPRNLNAKVMAKADAIVSAAMVSGKVSVETTATDAAIIDNNAMAVAQLRLLHRGRIGKQASLVELLTSQLEEAARGREEIENAIHEDTKEDGSGQRRSMMLKAVSLQSHSTIAVNLSNALKTLIGLERQAFSIKDETDSPASANPLASLLEQIQGTPLRPRSDD